MNISLKWLSDYVKIDATPAQIASRMTMTGTKVEGYEHAGEHIKNVVVGRLISIDRHPDADTLLVCSVDVGTGEPQQVITAAKNLAADDYVPVALPGSTLAGGQQIGTTVMRGIESRGMLCSLGELGLTAHDFPYADEDGIFVLGPEETAAPGTDIHTAIGLDDISMEFEITSNRPDCQSVIGVAREAAATFEMPLTLPDLAVKGSGGDINEYLAIEVQRPDLCPRYTARVIKNVKIGPSPRWMREKLRESGVRAINNMVDITNFVMLEYGQPLHAFDIAHVEGAKIIVRTAQPGEGITTLDGRERELTTEMLVIADANSPTAVAGVMGGEYSSILEDTNTVIIESANFNGVSIRRTSRALGLRTDASGRYEKGIDPQLTMPAVQRVCQLIELLGVGEVVDGIIDVDNTAYTPTTVKLEHEWTNRFLGTDIPHADMVRYLELVGFTVSGDEVTVPSWRGDVTHKADLAEEIARLYGYDNIPSTVLRGEASALPTPRQRFERAAKANLLAQGCSEIITYSFISPKYYDNILLPEGSPLRDSVKILNPLGEDTSVMRTTAIPSMLEVLARNANYRNARAWLYEMAVEYTPTAPEQLPDERLKIVIGMYGDGADFLTLKGTVETLLAALSVQGASFDARTDDPTFHPGRCATLTAGGQEIGVLGEVHPDVMVNYGIGNRCYVANLSVDALEAAAEREITYRPLPKFPPVERDLALICDEGVTAASLEAAIKRGAGELLESVELFDIYRGAQLGEGKKSLAFRLTLRHPERTLTDDEGDGCVTGALAEAAKLGAAIRK